MEQMNITREIFQVAGAGLTTSEDAASYLIKVGTGAALIDIGTGDALDKMLTRIKKCGVDPESLYYVFLTHCHYDHTGGAAGLKDLLPQIKIVSQTLEAPYLEKADQNVTAASWYGARIKPVVIDVKWSGPTQTFQLSDRLLTGYHTPGHSPGSAVYVMESEGLKILFGQDVHGPLHPSLLSNRDDYRRSLSLLLELEADILCEGHYGVYRGKKAVANFIRKFL
jgi:glyoxylase-like metal-dependent hydrolase (beta-lactamase superfamily II)